MPKKEFKLNLKWYIGSFIGIVGVALLFSDSYYGLPGLHYIGVLFIALGAIIAFTAAKPKNKK
jgi:drug/metabolite transporter (DMT)-like permease